MADFLVVVGRSDRADFWFARGIATANALGRSTDAVLELGSTRIATFTRGNGTSPTVTRDGGRWLLTSGTWLPRAKPGPRTDVELLNALATRSPGDVAADLEGRFALVDGGDADDGVCRVVTDAGGTHHTFVRRDGDAAAIGGSAVLLASLEPAAVDSLALQEFLATGVLYEDRTPWLDVRRLDAATVCDVSADRPTTAHRWWTPASLEPESLGATDAADAFASAATDVARRLNERFEQPIADLTGGWDSRLLLASLRAAHGAFETTVTGTPGSGDVIVSQELADLCGLTHHVVPPAGAPTGAELDDAFRLCDGLVNVLAYARVRRVHTRFTDRFDASLNGSFGEVARAYWWEILPALDARKPLDAQRVAAARYAVGWSETGLFAPADRIDVMDHLAGVVTRIDRELGDAPQSFRLDAVYLGMRMRCWHGAYASSTDRLWPCLAPIGSRSVLEPLLRCEARARQNNGLARLILARHAPDLARHRLEAGGPALPFTLANAWRFAPVALALAKKVVRKLAGGGDRPLEESASARVALCDDERVRDLLDPGEMALAPHLDPAGLERFVRAARTPEFGHDLPFGRLLGLEMALRAARQSGA